MVPRQGFTHRENKHYGRALIVFAREACTKVVAVMVLNDSFHHSAEGAKCKSLGHRPRYTMGF
jgi:hypothetical protein